MADLEALHRQVDPFDQAGVRLAGDFAGQLHFDLAHQLDQRRLVLVAQWRGFGQLVAQVLQLLLELLYGHCGVPSAVIRDGGCARHLCLQD
ncbi:hypothetical protein D3C78_1350600 [compost metagenome]